MAICPVGLACNNFPLTAAFPLDRYEPFVMVKAWMRLLCPVQRMPRLDRGIVGAARGVRKFDS